MLPCVCSVIDHRCGKNKKVAHEAQPSVSLMFLPHFDVLCDLLLNRRTATWNLFVLYNKKIKIHGKMPFITFFFRCTIFRLAKPAFFRYNDNFALVRDFYVACCVITGNK